MIVAQLSYDFPFTRLARHLQGSPEENNTDQEEEGSPNSDGTQEEGYAHKHKRFKVAMGRRLDFGGLVSVVCLVHHMAGCADKCADGPCGAATVPRGALWRV